LAYEEAKRNIKNGIMPDGAISKFDEKIDVNDIGKRLNKLLN